VETRFGFRYPDEPEPRDDTLPVELPPLVQWRIGQRLLDGALRGYTERRCSKQNGAVAACHRESGKPPLPDIEGMVDAILQETAGLRLPAIDSCQVEVSLDGRRLKGTVGNLIGNVAATVQYARVQPKHIAAAYLRLVALTAQDPGIGWKALLIGREAKPREGYTPRSLGRSTRTGNRSWRG